MLYLHKNLSLMQKELITQLFKAQEIQACVISRSMCGRLSLSTHDGDAVLWWVRERYTILWALFWSQNAEIINGKDITFFKSMEYDSPQLDEVYPNGSP